jgi:signal transduction histidine kinase
MMEKASTLVLTPDAREMERLRDFLSLEGHQVHEGSSVTDLPALEAKHRPEVIVIDAFSDPDLASEVIRQSRSPDDEFPPCLIALIPEGNADAAQGVIEAGADDWLGWPARRQTLLMRIAMHGRRRRLREVLGARLVENRALARQRDQMMSMITHDMKSPLTIILGHLRLLEDGRYGALPGDEAREALASATRNAKRLISYIDDFLSVSQSLTGPLEMRREPFALDPLLREIAKSHEGSAAEEEVTLDVAIEGELGEVTGDEDQITRAVENLLNNAIKYTGSGGRITLGAKPLKDGAEIWVEDTGRGIPAEELPHIFEPFHRGAGSERIARGTGLGLCVVRSIIDAHGGRVTVKSTLGAGSRFTIHLPRHPSHAARRSALIVEDNTDFARIMAMALRLEGVDSIICASAEEAIRVLQERRPDLITLDLMLPGIQGRQFIEDMAKRFGEHLAPVLALSASERRLEGLGDIPMVRIRMHKDAFDQSAFRQAARELLEQGESTDS